MLDIKGSNVKLWVNEHEGRNGKFNTFSISFSKKLENGKYANKNVKLFLPKGAYIPDSVSNGMLIDFEGFPTLDIFTDKDGNERREVAVFATSVDWGEEYEEFTKAEEDIPF